MKKSSLKEFNNSLEKNKGERLKEQLETGETGWFTGIPAKGEPGTVSLLIENGFTITLLEKDVIEYMQVENKFYLKVKH